MRSGFVNSRKPCKLSESRVEAILDYAQGFAEPDSEEDIFIASIENSRPLIQVIRCAFAMRIHRFKSFRFPQRSILRRFASESALDA